MQRSGRLLRTLSAATREAKAAEQSAWDCGSRAATTSAQEVAAEGIKAKLFKILGDSEPLTSSEIWAKAEAEGARSKRHVKLMLQDLKQRGWVTTRPPPADSARRDRSYRYQLKQKPQSRSQPLDEAATV